MLITLHGPDTFRSLLELRRIEEKHTAAHKGTNFFKFDCGERAPVFNEIEAACGTRSLFKEPTLVVVKELFSETAYEKQFLYLVDHCAISDTKEIVLVLWEPTKLSAALLKKLEKYGKAYAFELLGGASLRTWAAKAVEVEGGSIEDKALTMLLERCGDDTGRLTQEIKKLVAYSSAITLEHTEALVPAVFEGDVFKMLDALAEGSRARAFHIFETLLRGGEAELKLLAMLAFEVRGLLKIKTMPPGSKDSSMHPFVQKKLSRVVGRFSEEKLKMLYALLHTIDRSIKTGTPSPKMLLTRALCSF